MKELKNKLNKIVKSRFTGNNMSPDIAMDAMIEFYDQNKTQTPDDDMLLFQYGAYDILLYAVFS